MTQAEILSKVADGSMTPEQAQEELAKSAAPMRSLHCKVSDKSKALSVYGLNAKWPVTLYVEQWERLLAFGDNIKAFAEKHVKELARKSAV